MGRYYSGDIEGKFWFACQSSDDADSFGVTGTPPDDRLVYYFREQDMPKIEQGLKDCIDQLNAYSPMLLDLLDAYHFGSFNTEKGVYEDSEEWLSQSDESIPTANIQLARKHKSQDEMIRANSIILGETDTNTVDEVYARLILGRKIHKCVERTEQCWFEAEL